MDISEEKLYEAIRNLLPSEIEQTVAMALYNYRIGGSNERKRDAEIALNALCREYGKDRKPFPTLTEI